MLQVLAPLVIIIAAVGGYAGLHWTKPEPEKKDRTPRALSVFVDAVERKDVALVVLTQGEVRAGHHGRPGIPDTRQSGGCIF